MLDHKEVIIDGEADEDVKTFSDPHRAREIVLSDLNIDVEKADELTSKNRAIDQSTMELILKDIAESQGSSEKVEVAEKRTRYLANSTILRFPRSASQRLPKVVPLSIGRKCN